MNKKQTKLSELEILALNGDTSALILLMEMQNTNERDKKKLLKLSQDIQYLETQREQTDFFQLPKILDTLETLELKSMYEAYNEITSNKTRIFKKNIQRNYTKFEETITKKASEHNLIEKEEFLIFTEQVKKTIKEIKKFGIDFSNIYYAIAKINSQEQQNTEVREEISTIKKMFQEQKHYEAFKYATQIINALKKQKKHKESYKIYDELIHYVDTIINEKIMIAATYAENLKRKKLQNTINEIEFLLGQRNKKSLKQDLWLIYHRELTDETIKELEQMKTQKTINYAQAKELRKIAINSINQIAESRYAFDDKFVDTRLNSLRRSYQIIEKRKELKI